MFIKPPASKAEEGQCGRHRSARLRFLADSSKMKVTTALQHC
jgi:hypothetical protein